MFDVAYLVNQTEVGYDNIGNPIIEETETEVFVDVLSVSQSEFFNAGQNGLKPEYKMILFTYDYGLQDKVKYNDKFYSVYRTYQNGDKTELYLTAKVGVTYGK